MSERENFSSFFAGFLAGAVAGAIATILYTPKSGEETRSNIREKTDEFSEKANLSVDDAYKQAESAARVARDRFATLASATRDRAEEITRRGQVILEQRINNMKKKAEESSDNEVKIGEPEETIVDPVEVPVPDAVEEILMPSEDQPAEEDKPEEEPQPEA